MMNKIIKNLNSINSFSRNIIITGCSIALFICIAGMILINYNAAFSQQVHLYKVGSTMISTACVLFSNVVIGALLIDLFNNFVNNHDD